MVERECSQQLDFRPQLGLENAGGVGLLELCYEYFWRPFPMVIPYHFLQERLLANPQHGLDTLWAVMQWIGSMYASSVDSNALYELAIHAMQQAPRTPFNVQALALLALAQHHDAKRDEARKSLDAAVAMALALRMNEQGFARAYGEGNAVLEESWRRTYYILYGIDQELAVASRFLTFAMADVVNTVDLPCDDCWFESGVSLKR